jgi:hypothetical protein
MTAEPSFADAVGARWTVDVDAPPPRAWDEVVAGFADASYDQTACWVEARWGAQRSSHLLVRRDGRPVAGARAVLLRWPGIRRGIAYVKCGPLCRRATSRPPLEHVSALRRGPGRRVLHAARPLPHGAVRG